MIQDIYLFLIHQKEIDMYLIFSVCRAPKRLASSVLLSIGPMHWLISWREKANVVSCCCCSPPRHIPRHRPTQKERALSLNWRTEVTFVTILPTANTCPVQREREAQTNVSCYTESPAGHRGPSGKAMIRRGRDHSFFYWGQVHERQLQTSDIRRLYLPFRWHQRDPVKVRNFVSRLLHSAAVF
uniref:Uncharacterized protein n=1 Tax=Triticum urartu TaxID=4572 RepID=A0A8R7U3C1_TRIUA